MLDIKQIRYFIAVAEDLHFSRAADRLHIAQSALSTQIKQLEAELGARLIARKKRAAATLTDAGELFLIEARRVLEQVQRAEAAGRRAGRGELGHVEVGYVPSVAFSGLIPKAILEFRKQRPDVALHLAALESPMQLEAIAEGRLDIGFIRPRPSYSPGVTAEVLRQEKLLLAMPAGHPLTTSDDMTSLSHETLIVPQFDERADFSEYVADFVSSVQVPPENMQRVRDFLTALILVAGGRGVALVPESLRGISMANVAFRPIGKHGRTIGLAVAYRANESAPAVRAFIETCKRLRR
jgi:DNA-binding transcriptional LysR family regulator